MATHSSILAWIIPRTEESGGLQSMGLQRIRHHWATNTFTFIYYICVCVCVCVYTCIYTRIPISEEWGIKMLAVIASGWWFLFPSYTSWYISIFHNTVRKSVFLHEVLLRGVALLEFHREEECAGWNSDGDQGKCWWPGWAWGRWGREWSPLEGNAAPDAECWGIQQLTGQPGNHEQPTGMKADELVS